MRSILIVAAASLACGTANAAAPDAQEQAHETWRAAIEKTPLPEAGCFTATFPRAEWHAVACKAAPARPYVPRHAHGRGGYTVGDGNDYAAVASSLVSSSTGSFPSVSGVKSEKGYGGQANAYSIQLNSQFFSTPVCNGAAAPSSCLGWQQFVYSNSSGSFMQYWLINYGSKCPSGGWMAYSGDCYRNSSEVSVPAQAIAQLSHLKLTGTAVARGTDTFVTTTATNAYSTTGNDSVVDLAGAWNAAEFNIVGDGGGSAAKFNKGSHVKVQITLKDGNSAAPACQSNDGTTGETNNLTLGACTATGGTPTVSFTESD